MRAILRTLAAGLVLASAVSTASADDVKVKGVHLCCGACVSAVDKALKPVEGVSAIAADRDSKLVSFKAADQKAAQAGIDALAKAGFFGTASHGDKALKFPESGAKKGDTADIVTLGGVHLCCGACVTGAKEAVKDVKNVSSIDVDRAAGTVKLTGKSVDVTEAVEALNKAGFLATVKK
jgi:copper chaperone CopZ